jgi:hypothetical protein
MKIRKGTKVKLTSEIMAKIKAHANESWSYYYNPNNRPKEQVIADIIRGKMAEYGYYIMCKNEGIKVTEPDLTNHKNGTDGGKDFTVENKTTVNVKSLNALNPGYRQVPIPDLYAEAYVLCWVDVYNKIVTYEGAITRNKIQTQKLLEEGTNRDTGKTYKYVDKKHLSELNENFE